VWLLGLCLVWAMLLYTLTVVAWRCWVVVDGFGMGNSGVKGGEICFLFYEHVGLLRFV
jgi:hypothetical protein